MESNLSSCEILVQESPFDPNGGPSPAVVFFNVLFIIFFLPYLIISMYWAISRRNHRNLRVRHLGMAGLSTLGAILVLIVGPIRDVVGRYYFPCSTLIGGFTVCVPLIMGPIVTRMLMVHNRLVYQRAILQMTRVVREGRETAVVKMGGQQESVQVATDKWHSKVLRASMYDSATGRRRNRRKGESRDASRRKGESRDASRRKGESRDRQQEESKNKPRQRGEPHDKQRPSAGATKTETTVSYNMEEVLLSAVPSFEDSGSSAPVDQLVNEGSERTKLQKAYRRTTRTHANRLLFTVCVTIMLCTLVIWSADRSFGYAGCTGCFLSSGLLAALAVPSLLASTVSAFLVWNWKAETDAYGLWWELRTQIATWSIGVLLFVPFEASDPGALSKREEINWAIFLYIALVVTHTISVPLQVLKTYLPNDAMTNGSSRASRNSHQKENNLKHKVNQRPWEARAEQFAMWLWANPHKSISSRNTMKSGVRMNNLTKQNHSPTRDENISRGLHGKYTEQLRSDAENMLASRPTSEKEGSSVEDTSQSLTKSKGMSRRNTSSRHTVRSTRYQLRCRANALVRGGIPGEPGADDSSLLLRLEHVLESPEGFELFRAFSVTAFQVEMLELYRETSVWKNEYSNMSQIGAIEIAAFIHEDFLETGGVMEVQPITRDATSEAAIARLGDRLSVVRAAPLGTGKLNRDTFDEIISLAYTKMEEMLFPQFCSSPFFEAFVEVAEGLGGIGDDCMASVSARFEQHVAPSERVPDAIEEEEDDEVFVLEDELLPGSPISDLEDGMSTDILTSDSINDVL